MTDHVTRRRVLAAAAASGAMAGGLGALPALAGSDGKLHEIEIRNFRFVPATLEVRPGDRIRWTNRDGAPHNATADDGSWRTPDLRRNRSAEVTASAGMSGDYYCSIHPQMRARLVVVTG